MVALEMGSPGDPVVTALGALGQLLLLLVLAPWIQGLIKRIKARLQGRQGPGIGQPWADLRKYLRKEMVIPTTATWLFWTAPFVYFAAVLAAGLLAPTVVATAPLGFGGDLAALIYLLALGRFALALATLESGSAFAGMGSSREMALAALVEPALLLALGTFYLRTGTTSLGPMTAVLAGGGWGTVQLSHLLGVLALLVVVVAETGRLPVDNPDTHLELTMIHEGMVLEYSGPLLALIVWAAQLKQLLMLVLLANLAFPWGMPTVSIPAFGAFAINGTPTAWGHALAAFSAALATVAGPLLMGTAGLVVKVAGLGVLLAVLETMAAKIRILRLPEFLTTALLLSGLAVLVHWGMGG